MPAGRAGVGNAQLDAILKYPGNDVCADCTARLPRWASINLGIFVCIDCAGHHRKLGVHLSQVRSLTLDKWKPAWVERVKAIGNTLSNAYYESNLPADVKKPSVGDEASSIEAFIRKKYEACTFAPKGGTPPHVYAEKGQNPRLAIEGVKSSATHPPEKKVMAKPSAEAGRKGEVLPSILKPSKEVTLMRSREGSSHRRGSSRSSKRSGSKQPPKSAAKEKVVDDFTDADFSFFLGNGNSSPPFLDMEGNRDFTSFNGLEAVPPPPPPLPNQIGGGFPAEIAPGLYDFPLQAFPEDMGLFTEQPSAFPQADGQMNFPPQESTYLLDTQPVNPSAALFPNASPPPPVSAGIDIGKKKGTAAKDAIEYFLGHSVEAGFGPPGFPLIEPSKDSEKASTDNGVDSLLGNAAVWKLLSLQKSPNSKRAAESSANAATASLMQLPFDNLDGLSSDTPHALPSSLNNHQPTPYSFQTHSLTPQPATFSAQTTHTHAQPTSFLDKPFVDSGLPYMRNSGGGEPYPPQFAVPPPTHSFINSGVHSSQLHPVSLFADYMGGSQNIQEQIAMNAFQLRNNFRPRASPEMLDPQLQATASGQQALNSLDAFHLTSRIPSARQY